MQGKYSSFHVPLGHEATVVFADASAPEQLPYVHDTAAGQHGGHADSEVGKSAGHSGRGGGVPPYTQAPRKHRAIGVPHAPNAHVVPSGKRQGAALSGAASGQMPLPRPPAPPPASASPGVLVASSLQAPAIAAEPITTSAASIHLRGSIQGRLEL